MLEELRDPTFTQWIDCAVTGPPNRNFDPKRGALVSDFVPNEFESYARLLPAFHIKGTFRNLPLSWPNPSEVFEPEIEWVDRLGRPFHRILWRRLVELVGLAVGSDLTVDHIRAAIPEGTFKRFCMPPGNGHLGLREIGELVSILRQFTKPDWCKYFYSTVTLISLGLPDLNPRMFNGNLAEVEALTRREDLAGSPTYWWPESREWCVYSDYDEPFAIVAGSKDLVSKLKGLRRQEFVEVSPETRVL